MMTTKKRMFWQAGSEILINIAYWSYYVWVILSFIAGKITLGSVTFFSSAYMSIQDTIHSLFAQINKTLNDGLLLQNYYDVIKASNIIESSGTASFSEFIPLIRTTISHLMSITNKLEPLF